MDTHLQLVLHLRRLLGRRGLRQETGQTTVEYALALTFVILVAIASFAALNGALTTFFSGLTAQLAAAAAGI
jgi:Flp pilus assembly pilin Flp